MRLQIKNKRPNFKIPSIFQFALNIALVLLGITLCVLLGKEILYFINISIFNQGIENHYILLESILIFFLYFEFIAMIVKYFLEDYHFPLRYFLYIGITALIRLVIVDHDDSVGYIFAHLRHSSANYQLFDYEYCNGSQAEFLT